MAQVVKVLALHARDPIWAPVLSRQPRFPSTSLLVVWESSQGQPKALGPCTHMGDLEEVPGSWFQIGVALAVGSESLDRRSSSLPLLLSVYLTFQ